MAVRPLAFVPMRVASYTESAISRRRLSRGLPQVRRVMWGVSW